MNDMKKEAENRIAFEIFDDFLELGQSEIHGRDGTDIREEVLSRRSAHWGAGYAKFNLKDGYAANMSLLMPNIKGISKNCPDLGAAIS